MRVPFRSLLAAGVVTAVAVIGGVVALDGSAEDPAPSEPPEEVFATTALADYDTSTVAVRRGRFCESVDARQVEAVLGVAPDAVAWEDGDKVDLGGPGPADIVHEYGCRYAVQDVGEASAWVFAPPVTADQAARLTRSARRGPGCEPGEGPTFGSPTLALTCTDQDQTARASFRGLFGDAWLVCEVALAPGPAAQTGDLLDRAGRWCVGVLEAARGAAA